MKPFTIYRLPAGSTKARPVPFEDADRDVRANAPHLWPWSWIGVLFAGLPVATPNAVYALRPSVALDA